MTRRKRVWARPRGMLALLLVLLMVAALGGAQETKEMRFLKWTDDHGAAFSEYLEWPVEFPKTGRGVRARKTIHPKTRFLQLPRNLILNSRNALTIDGLRGMEHRFYKEPEALDRHRHFDRMVLVLMKEKYEGERSFWKPYLDIVPGPDPNGLVFWTEEELSELENDAIVESREVFLEERQSCWETIDLFLKDFPDWFAGENASTVREIFDWSFNAIASRSFQLQDDPEEFNMIPFADLLNHHSMSSVGWGLQGNHFEMRLLPSSPNPVEAGNEVFNHYGDLTTERTLLDYSFIVDENYLEEVTVEMPLDTPFLEEKRDLWDGSELDLDHFTKVSHILQFCRIVTASKQIVQGDYKFERPFNDVNLEISSMLNCASMIRSTLKGKTSLGEDLEELAKGNVAERRRLALQYKSARKRLVVHYAEFLERSVEDFVKCIPYRRSIQQKPLNWYYRRLQQMSRSKMF